MHYSFVYFTHGTQPSSAHISLHTDTSRKGKGGVGANIHEHANTHKDYRFSTVTHLKHIWERERESALIRPHTEIFNNVRGIEDTASSLIITQQDRSPPLCVCMLYVFLHMYMWRLSVINILCDTREHFKHLQHFKRLQHELMSMQICQVVVLKKKKKEVKMKQTKILLKNDSISVQFNTKFYTLMSNWWLNITHSVLTVTICWQLWKRPHNKLK